jgi:hypothetical protein
MIHHEPFVISFVLLRKEKRTKRKLVDLRWEGYGEVCKLLHIDNLPIAILHLRNPLVSEGKQAVKSGCWSYPSAISYRPLTLEMSSLEKSPIVWHPRI